MSGRRMTRELDELIQKRGKPDVIVSDNGTEMTSHAVLRWCQDTGVGWHYIASRCPAAHACMRKREQTDAERLCRSVQWAAARRMP